MKGSKEQKRVIKLRTPIADSEIKKLRIGDQIEINGMIYCGRDAVLPKLVSLIEGNALQSINVDLKGTVIFHTAVSLAGVGPTTSSKVEIEGSIPALSKAGVKIHLGKGALSLVTTEQLKKNNSVFAITPPISALFSDKTVSHRVVAFEEEGMEALYELDVKELPAIIAIAHGESIFSQGVKSVGC
ncbi:L(+)-tartrate dehydratase subunit beta [subsurface metagenome]